MTRPAPAVGIDLGTTFSVVAHIDAIGQPRTILNSEGDATLPSAVMFDRENVIVGKEALRAAAQDPDLVVRFAKREMGNKHYSRQIAGRSDWSPEMIQSFILQRLKDDAEKVIGPFSQAVITVPAYFNDSRRQATEECAKLANIDVLDIMNEPSAAALAYMHNRPESQNKLETILVYDLGGGTFDVTVVEVAGDRFKTLATNGNVTLGGYDWDQAIVKHICDEYSREHRGIDPSQNAGMLQRLLQQSEDIKRSLSQKSEAKVFLDPPYQFRMNLTRDKFEELTEDLVARTRWLTEDVRKAANKQWSEIDTVLLVGGSGRMPMIKRMLEQLTAKPVTESISKDECVAWGAALYAKAILDRRAGKSTLTVENVNSHSLGVPVADKDTGNRRLSVILPANQRLPAEGKRKYGINRVTPTLRIQVFEGGDLNCKNGYVGEVVVRPVKPLESGERVEITFRYDPNGRLRVMVHRISTDERWDQELDRSQVAST